MNKPNTRPPHIVYLHGFLSGSGSRKAVDTGAWMQKRGLSEHFHCPDLQHTPQAAAMQIQQIFASLQGERVCVVGSSLGGFYATWAAEEFGCRAVLINPAVRPYTLLADYIGPQRNYITGEIHNITPNFADELQQIERKPSDLGQYWLLVQTGDETLDYRDAVDYYQGCRQTILPGGNHSFVDYQAQLPQIWEFAQEGA